jgi:glutathione peroxidase-family protein
MTKKFYLNIDKVEVERETNVSVWLKNGRREAKISDYSIYHNSFTEAKEYLINRKEKEIQRYQCEIKDSKQDLNIINGLEDK